MEQQKLFLSKHIVLEDTILDGGILVDSNGKITKILNDSEVEIYKNAPKTEVSNAEVP